MRFPTAIFSLPFAHIIPTSKDWFYVHIREFVFCLSKTRFQVFDANKQRYREVWWKQQSRLLGEVHGVCQNKGIGNSNSSNYLLARLKQTVIEETLTRKGFLFQNTCISFLFKNILSTKTHLLTTSKIKCNYFCCTENSITYQPCQIPFYVAQITSEQPRVTFCSYIDLAQIMPSLQDRKIVLASGTF